LSNPVNTQTSRQTNKQTDTGESITSLAEAIRRSSLISLSYF